MCTPDPVASEARNALLTIAGHRGPAESIDQMLYRVARMTGIDLVRIQGYWRRDIQRVPYSEGLRIFAAAAEAKAQADRAALAARDADAARQFRAERIAMDSSPELAAIATACQLARSMSDLLASRLPTGGAIADRALGLHLHDSDPIRLFAGRSMAIDHQRAIGRSVRQQPCMDATEPLMAQLRAVAGGAEVLAFRCRGPAGNRLVDYEVATAPDPRSPDVVWRIFGRWWATEIAA